jgi:hypothetical protein
MIRHNVAYRYGVDEENQEYNENKKQQHSYEVHFVLAPYYQSERFPWRCKPQERSFRASEIERKK